MYISLWQSKTLCGMVRSGSGLGSEAFMPKSGNLKETLASQRGTISKIFEEGIFTWKNTTAAVFFLEIPSLDLLLFQLAFSWSSKCPGSAEVWRARGSDSCCQSGC